jgi:hypothetical protein
MPTTAVRWRGGWILLVTGTLQPGAVGPFEHVYGEAPDGSAIDITTDSTVTLTVAQIIQQWESSSGNLLCPLAYTELERENARLARNLEPITATASLTPLPKIYGATGAAGDATSLQGVPIAVTAPAEGQALVYLTGAWRPGGWNKGPRFVVGNALAGDTLAVCDYLDAGDGVQLQAALTAAGLLAQDADVWVRPGPYTLATPITIPSLVTMRCSGWGTIFNVTATQRQAFLVQASASMEDVSIAVPVPAVGATGTTVVELATNTWVKRLRIVMATQNAGQAANESLRYGIRTPSGGSGGVHLSYVTMTMISFRALGIAQDMVGFFLESLLAASLSVLSDTRVQSADVGYDLHGAVVCMGWHANSAGRIGARLGTTNAPGASREGPRLGYGAVRMLAIAGTPQFGVVLETGTDALGMIGATVSDVIMTTTSVEPTSCGVSLEGTGVGASLDNIQVNTFPLGVSVAAGQTYARAANITTRGATTPWTDLSTTGTPAPNFVVIP